MPTASEDPFPLLDAADLATLDRYGARERVVAGGYLYRAGERASDLLVLVEGVVDILIEGEDGSADLVVVRHVPGGFLGELSMLTGRRLFVSARVVEDGEVIRVPASALRDLLRTDPHLGDTLLSAFMARRTGLLSEAASSLRLLGPQAMAATRRVREFLFRSRIPHEWLDPETDKAAAHLLCTLAIDETDLPVVVQHGMVLRRASPERLAEYLHLSSIALPERTVDVVIVGTGPAGLAAAVSAASEGLRTLAIDLLAAGGQAGTSSRLDNYLGFPTGVSGTELTQRATVQAEKFGAVLSSPCAAIGLRRDLRGLVVELDDATEVTAGAVIVATGARYRRLDVDRLEQFEGVGVFYAATELEAGACAGAPVMVVGGGNSAGQAAMFLAEAACDVTVVVRKGDLRAAMSQYLVDRLNAHPRVHVEVLSTVAALHGEATLCAATLRGPTGEVVRPCAGLFSFIGAEPATGWLSELAALDDRGFLRTDLALTPGTLGHLWDGLGRAPLPFETSHPGVFAAGDVRSGSTKRVAAAVGEGSAAVGSVHAHLRYLR